MTKKNPKDASAKGLSELRKEVRNLEKKVSNLEQYYDKFLADMQSDIYKIQSYLWGNGKVKKS